MLIDSANQNEIFLTNLLAFIFSVVVKTIAVTPGFVDVVEALVSYLTERTSRSRCKISIENTTTNRYYNDNQLCKGYRLTFNLNKFIFLIGDISIHTVFTQIHVMCNSGADV